MPRYAPSTRSSESCGTSSARRNRRTKTDRAKEKAGLAACLFCLWDGVLSGRLRPFSGARFLVFLFETVDAARGVHQLLFASEERVAGRADFHAHIAFVGGARLEAVSASADDTDFVVSGMNTGLHGITGIPFEIFSIPESTNPRGRLGPRG